MRHIIFGDEPKEEYPLVLLSPVLNIEDMRREYLTPFNVNPDGVLALDLYQDVTKKKTPVKQIKEYIESELVPVLTDMGAKYLVVCDAEYFKVLAKVTKADAHVGYVLDCAYGPWKVIYVPSYKAIFYDPEKVRNKIKIGMGALASFINGSYIDPGVSIVHFAEYPKTYEEIHQWLQQLLDMNKPLTVDIEGFSLKHVSCGIGSITFCWNKHEGIAFPVDYRDGKNIPNEPVRELLKQFFIECHKRKIKLIYHHIAFDVYVLIYQLFMDHVLDTEGMLYGIEIMLSHWDDTKLITYLATNSCAGNKLGLKDQSQEYAGNYAQTDIADITKIHESDLLKYNLIDGLSTWYVYEKHWKTVIKDDQLDVYENLFKPATIDIIQMQLTGMPVNMKRVKEVKDLLENQQEDALGRFKSSILVQEYTHHLKEKYVLKKNAEYKKKRITIEDVELEVNPNSPDQLQGLLYEMLGLPILDYTDSKQPATGGKTLEKLKNHTKDEKVLDVIQSLIDFKVVNKVITSFIPAMEEAVEGPDGWHYLFGNFNLGGTVSGRLSSSNPNLQNLPANSKLGKLIKSCFQAPKGWIFIGLDFASLEDRISALTTKDPNKLKVYTDGYDGHCLRAHAYFGDQMEGIDPTSVESINSIASKYKALRQESKVPTFALTYAGTYITLMTNLGMDETKAKSIEANYHRLYAASDKWVSDKLDQASRDGYVTVAFGLRLRTPLLHQVIRGNSKTPHEAEAEGRTAGNALGQSWCLLNSRAWIEFMRKVRDSKYHLDIRPCAQIHDAGYALVRDNLDILEYVNTHLVKAVQWQEHPDIAHDQVKLGGELSIFYPTWEKEIEIPNGANQNEIISIVKDAIAS